MVAQAEQAGLLSERMRFERRDETLGLAGDQSVDWLFAFDRWVRMEPLARAEPLPMAADTRHSAGRWRLTLRAGAQPSPGMRAVWRGGVLKVTGVETDPARRGWLVVWAEEFGASGA